MKKLVNLWLVIMSVFLLQACNDSDDARPVTTPDVVDPPVVTTIVDAAVSNGSFTTLVAALQATGLDATLADADASFTVFAPTDDAFALLGDETIAALLADTDTLSDILTYHVIGAEVNAAAAIAAAGTRVTMVNGDDIALSLMGESLLVNGATVTATDIITDNGIIHVIDAVLLPPADKGEPTMNIVDTAVANGNFTTLVAALQATNLVDALADEQASLTVFAPTDAAFAMIGAETLAVLLDNPEVLSSILLQHVVAAEVDSISAYSLNGQMATTLSGAMLPIAVDSDTDGLTFGGANITMKDIYTTNGVIHVIDMVVVADVAIPQPPMSIVDVAAGAGSFNTLVAALTATGLDATLADMDSQFTVFAPTDAAFAKLGDDVIAGLLADPETLTDILLYHVIAGAAIMQDGAVAVAQSAENKVTMANNKMAALSLSGSTLYVNTSRVSGADVMAGNGVIHVLDQVILPPAMAAEPTMSIAQVVAADENFSTLLAALSAADLVSAMADESATYTVFAPTNRAFDKIDDTALAGLLGNTEALQGVLLQHVVSGAAIGSVDAYAANGKMVDTMAGEDVSVNLVDFTQTMNASSDEVAFDMTNNILVGGMNSAMAGKTLYVFDADLGMTGSVCNGDCAVAWPPVLVTDDEVSIFRVYRLLPVMTKLNKPHI